MQRRLTWSRYPDGVFVTNNRMAVGVLRAPEQAVAIPNQMKVIGFDELPWRSSSILICRLCANQPIVSVKRRRVLIDCANKKKPSCHIVFEAELVERG